MVGRTIRIGAGAGFSGDRIEPAVELVTHGNLDYLAFECLAERTIALAQAARRVDPDAGYDPLLRDRMHAVLPQARARGVRIVSNMGAANPVAAARATAGIARELGLTGLRVAAVTGDDVLDRVVGSGLPLIERPGTVDDLGSRIISANAYLGAAPIVEALRGGADVVMTGRVGDPALFLAPLIHEFDWDMEDWATLGAGTAVGHLLECAGQLTGGYFADPGMKDVPRLAELGFPFADVAADGTAVLGKVARSGGRLSVATAKEQLLYELLDPAAYLQADVTADFSVVSLRDAGLDRVAVSGATGRTRPPSFKVSIGYQDGFIGEGQISYAGPNAVARGRLAAEIVEARLRLTNAGVGEVRSELIGVDAISRTGHAATGDPREVRVRVVGRAGDRLAASRIGAEVEALYTNGPFGGGGAVGSVRAVTAVASVLLPRDQVSTAVHYEVA